MAGRKKRVVRKRANVSSKTKAKTPVSSQGRIFSNVKLGVVFRNFILFVLIFFITYILSKVSNSTLFINLFEFLWIIFAFISIAFLIALLVLLFLKWLRR